MSITVKATQLGYYGMSRRHEGDIFEIQDEKEFSKKWMKKVKARTHEEEEDDLFARKDTSRKSDIPKVSVAQDVRK